MKLLMENWKKYLKEQFEFEEEEELFRSPDVSSSKNWFATRPAKCGITIMKSML